GPLDNPRNRQERWTPAFAGVTIGRVETMWPERTVRRLLLADSRPSGTCQPMPHHRSTLQLPVRVPADPPPMPTHLQETRRRRTFAIVSHPDAGKTTLTEKLLL